MAAPSALRAEAQSVSSIILVWVSGSGSDNLVDIYRSTDGVSYSAVSENVVLETALTFTDTNLATGTKYWYKISNDSGITFSSVVTVYTHFCAEQNAGQAFQLPRFDEGMADQSSSLNDMAERVERAIGDQVIAPATCIVCPSDNTVVIDCTDGCNSFLVIADQDINSFSITRCEGSPPTVNVYVPPGITVGICGFPAGFGYSGDECKESPISGGTLGKTVGVAGGSNTGGSIPGLPPARTGNLGGNSMGGGGGAGGATCECVPGEYNQLTIKCCTADPGEDCSLDCSGGKSVDIRVCGGVGPYVMTKTGSVQYRKKDGTGSDTAELGNAGLPSKVTLQPPTNAAPATAGTAYRLDYVTCSVCAAGHACFGAGQVAAYLSDLYGCNDQFISSTTTSDCGDGFAATIPPAYFTCCPSSCTDPSASGPPRICKAGACLEHMCDKRSAGMISAGCTPCALSAGSVVTATDASGVSVSISIKA